MRLFIKIYNSKLYLSYSSTDNLEKRMKAGKENPLDNQVAALQQAVALLQMGNIFETDINVDNEATTNVVPSRNVQR